MTVEVYSGAERVQLYLNDKLIGEKLTGRGQQFKAEFEVPYESGTLKAVGLRGGRTVAESVLCTIGDPVQLKLIADRNVVKADGQDLAFVTVEAVDENGNLQMNGSQTVGPLCRKWCRNDCSSWKWGWAIPRTVCRGYIQSV